MRILILDTYYQEPLRLIYESHPGLEQRSYAEQARAVYDFGFARANFLPLNLQKLGHEAEQFIINSHQLQRRWAEEHGLASNSSPLNLGRLARRGYHSIKWRLGFRWHQVPDDWQQEVICAQVEDFDPEVIFITDVLPFSIKLLKKLKSGKRLLVGEIGYPIPRNFNLRPYALILSCAPHFVERFRRAGIQSELFRLGFEASILQRLGAEQKSDGAVFIGSVSSYHQERVQLLEEVNQRVPLSCWGAGANSLPQDSSLRAKVQPPLWGYDMYRQLQRARIALNVHIDIAENSAANMRLYEATGVGTMLLTDWKVNLHELFEPGKEVVAYHTPRECAEMIVHYLDHDEEREKIARAGQQRTLREHTYHNRMQELCEILERHLQTSAGSKMSFL